MLIWSWPMTGFAIPAVRGESIRTGGGCRATAKRGPGKIAYIARRRDLS